MPLIRILHTALLSIFILFAFGQSRLQVAPTNPDYIKFLNEMKSGEEMDAAPSPYKLGFKEYYKQKKYQAAKSFPTVYDMRTAGPDGTSLLTPVKHQLSCGACWAFATTSSIESTWKKMEWMDYDLSENNLKNCHGFDLDPCEWGHHFMSTSYLVRGSGPILELDDPYNPMNAPCIEGLTPAAYIPESRYLPEDHDAFKQVIMDHGAVYNTYRSEGASYEWIYGHLTYCYQGGETTTHAIAIAGWNDTITTACGQGAWICKNSYGENFGEDGYFYISYKDTLVLKYNAIYPVKEDFDENLKIYQYDTIGGWPFVGYEDSVAYGLIKFEAESDMFISRVGTYTVAYGTTLSMDIFDDFDGMNVSNPISTTIIKYVEFPGYSTLDLSEVLQVDQGEDFYIQIKYNSPGEDFPIAVEGFDDGYTSPDIETGKCWSREETGPWEAWGADTDILMDICIKAYTHETTKLNLKVFLEGPFNGVNMNAELISASDFPLIQPYSISPWDYDGTESVTEVPANVVDWVLVELRDTSGTAGEASSNSVVAKRAGFLLSDGSIVDLDGISNLEFNVAIKNNLFAVIYHRNHLPVMSAIALQKTDELFLYDFTDDILKSFGNTLAHKELIPGVYGMIAGDAEASGI